MFDRETRITFIKFYLLIFIIEMKYKSAINVI